MRQWKRKGMALAAAFTLAAVSLTGCAGAIDPEETVMTVGEEEVSLGVANYYARMQQAQYESYYASMLGTTGEDIWSQEGTDGTDYEQTVKDGVLKNLKELYLIKQHAADYDVKLTEEEEQAIADAAKQFVEDNGEAEREAVSGEEKYIKEYLTLLTIDQKTEPLMSADVSEEVSDEEAAQKAMQYVFVTYSKEDENGEDTDMTDEEKASVKANAQTALDSVKAGETEFAVLAAALGAEVQSTTFDKDSYAPNTDLVAAADALTAEGEVTELVETDSGIYVAQLTSLLDREATDNEKETIVSTRKSDRIEELLEQWMEETEIKVNEKIWKKIEFQKLGVTMKTSEE